MTIKKRLEKLEKQACKTDKRPLTWAEFIRLANEGEEILGWDEFIKRVDLEAQEPEPDTK